MPVGETCVVHAPQSVYTRQKTTDTTLAPIMNHLRLQFPRGAEYSPAGLHSCPASAYCLRQVKEDPAMKNPKVLGATRSRREFLTQSTLAAVAAVQAGRA